MPRVIYNNKIYEFPYTKDGERNAERFLQKHKTARKIHKKHKQDDYDDDEPIADFPW